MNEIGKEESSQNNESKKDINTTKKNHFWMYYQNVNGLRTKTNVMKRAIDTNFIDCYILTETGLTHTIFDSEIFPAEYVVYRCDRTSQTSEKERKGGVLIAVHESFDSSLIESCDNIGLEHL